MAKGAESKTKIINKILETFEGSFLYDKEIRIPMTENGEQVQIKCTLTCAKVNVNAEGDNTPNKRESAFDNEPVITQITEEEKKEVVNLIEKLGL